MITCKCDQPSEHVNPRRKGWCARCLKQLDPAWLSTDKTLEEFLDHLQRGLFPNDETSSDALAFQAFRSLCESREFQGRDTFGLSYLARDNEGEAEEEAVDLAMYMHLSILQARQRGEDEEWSTAVEAARHAFLAFKFAQRHAAKRSGSP